MNNPPPIKKTEIPDRVYLNDLADFMAAHPEAKIVKPKTGDGWPAIRIMPKPAETVSDETP